MVFFIVLLIELDIGGMGPIRTHGEGHLKTGPGPGPDFFPNLRNGSGAGMNPVFDLPGPRFVFIRPLPGDFNTGQLDLGSKNSHDTFAVHLALFICLIISSRQPSIECLSAVKDLPDGRVKV
jgi:hypothetical protein